MFRAFRLQRLSEHPDNTGKQWITIFFTNIAIPTPAPYVASLCLLGTPQSPAKRSRLFAYTPCGVAFAPAYGRPFPHLSAEKKYLSIFDTTLQIFKKITHKALSNV